MLKSSIANLALMILISSKSLFLVNAIMMLISHERYYNKTRYSGLETHITNSYLNPLLQIFKFTPLVRNLALYHAASSCIADGCLLCEMGFLFDMLEKADGLSCQATNFLRAFSGIPEGWFRYSCVRASLSDA